MIILSIRETLATLTAALIDRIRETLATLTATLIDRFVIARCCKLKQ